MQEKLKKIKNLTPIKMDMPKYLRKIRVPYKVTKINPKKVVPKRHVDTSESRKLARRIARQVCGLAPYEKKAVDLMKMDELKKAKKFLKLRLGSWSRAERKFEDLIKHYK